MTTVGGTIAAVTFSRSLGGKAAQALALEGKKKYVEFLFSPHPTFFPTPEVLEE